jgi:tRNA(fMet)-specific endonuclease VapC
LITHLVDSDRIIDWFHSRADAREALAPLIDASRLATSIIVLGEIYDGLVGDPERDRKRQVLASFLANVSVISRDDETANMFAEVRSQLRSTGQIIGDHDIWIAATALQHDLTVITRDAHFDRIPGLKKDSLAT